MINGDVPEIDFAKIVASVTLAETQSFRVTAERTHMTRSTLSRHIKELEKTIGRELFRRGWSGSETTAEGEIVVRHFRRIIAALDRADLELREERKAPPVLRRILRRRHLAAVAAVVRNGSMSAAARECGCGQPEISRLISDASHRLGVDLFRRGRRGMDILPPADVLARADGAVSFEIAQMSTALQQTEGHVTGRVAVGVMSFSEQRIIPKVMAELSRHHPQVRLVIIPGSYPILIEALRRHEIDCIIGVLREAELSTGLVETHLYNERFTFLARRGHALHGAARMLSDLATADWIVAPHGTPVRTYFEKVFNEAGLSPNVLNCEILSFPAFEQMLVESDLVGMLVYSPRAMAELRPDLRRFDTPLPDQAAPIGLTQLADAPPSVAMQEFVQLLKKACHKEQEETVCDAEHRLVQAAPGSRAMLDDCRAITSTSCSSRQFIQS